MRLMIILMLFAIAVLSSFGAYSLSTEPADEGMIQAEYVESTAEGELYVYELKDGPLYILRYDDGTERIVARATMTLCITVNN